MGVGGWFKGELIYETLEVGNVAAKKNCGSPALKINGFWRQQICKSFASVFL